LDGHLLYQQQMAYGVSSGLLPQQSASMIAKYIDCFSFFINSNRKDQLVTDAQCHWKLMTPASLRTIASVHVCQPDSSGCAVWHAPCDLKGTQHERHTRQSQDNTGGSQANDLGQHNATMPKLHTQSIDK